MGLPVESGHRATAMSQRVLPAEPSTSSYIISCTVTCWGMRCIRPSTIHCTLTGRTHPGFATHHCLTVFWFVPRPRPQPHSFWLPGLFWGFCIGLHGNPVGFLNLEWVLSKEEVRMISRLKKEVTHTHTNMHARTHTRMHIRAYT